ALRIHRRRRAAAARVQARRQHHAGRPDGTAQPRGRGTGRSEPVMTVLSYQGASTAAIQSHYDVGNQFYELWLDPTRSYSCALWDGPDDSLETAQKRKLDYLVEGARAAGTGRVLDVGCGWGGLLHRLVRIHDVKRVTGLTLSQAQADHVRGWADDEH